MSTLFQIAKNKLQSNRQAAAEATTEILGIQARILGNSITEMKAFYRTYYCKI